MSVGIVTVRIVNTDISTQTCHWQFSAVYGGRRTRDGRRRTEVIKTGNLSFGGKGYQPRDGCPSFSPLPPQRSRGFHGLSILLVPYPAEKLVARQGPASECSHAVSHHSHCKFGNSSLLTDFIHANFVVEGMCADVCIHNTDGHNPHAHIIPRPSSPVNSGKLPVAGFCWRMEQDGAPACSIRTPFGRSPGP